ncbi:hypothetical protein Tco_0157369 [Tanacetum coccineum]
MRTIQKAHDAALDDGVVLVKRCGYFFLNWSSRSHVNSGPLLEFHRTLTNGIQLRFNRLTSPCIIVVGFGGEVVIGCVYGGGGGRIHDDSSCNEDFMENSSLIEVKRFNSKPYLIGLMDHLRF